MSTITRERLLTIKQWRETYGPGSNVVLPAEEAEELARIALASLAAVSDERAAYELFMEKRFGESVDRRRAKNGDREYMAWDMALGWIIWCHRAAMLLAGNFRENKGSSTNNFREISETSTNYPVTPDSWISCSERMPKKNQNVLISVNFDSDLVEPLICSARYTGSTFRRGEATIKPGNGVEQVTHWMPLPEPPQESKSE
ncbi:DUF551 domain-containing protein [Escherichia coli]|uniref:DUF551 domain-containing protein n=1 Tax=Escherichia coli TaxID=562 RepID=UPI0010D86FFD|nr:DUF551 domain-containing protein [Escherichia coli]EKK3462903.1 DUF551 domain-containing protein [Escherichia coli O145]EKY2436313.1 DUF551 domain-containing protein [Escherichia coli O104]EEQ4232237.1 DUF551 domain-containing protein [Escherichia coli]EEU5830584.1 DUF551 domain-containing protein [Escherichia coli]EEV0564977.1 DUF551 domain-containing protein [Escherichia coli]